MALTGQNCINIERKYNYDTVIFLQNIHDAIDLARHLAYVVI